MKGVLAERRRAVRESYPDRVKMTIWGCFESTALKFPDKEFAVIDGESYSYGQIRRESLQTACGLASLGIAPGVHVAFQFENSKELVLVMLALARLCAVKIPVNTSVGVCELKYILEQSDAEYFIAESVRADMHAGPKLKTVITVANALSGDRRYISWQKLFRERADIAKLPEFDGDFFADELSDIIYTSGSTSAPKGVLLTNNALMCSARANCINRGFEPGRRVFIPLPMCHVYGYVEGFLACILVAGCILLRRGRFDPAEIISFMKTTEANDILSVPVQMIALIDYLKKNPQKLPKLHAAYCSAALCPHRVWSGIRESFDITDLITGYGMTEVCGASMQTEPFDSDEILISKVGKLIYDCGEIEYKIEKGELLCKGIVVTEGYYNKPEVNARAFTDDGWFRTGDCGRFDDDSYFIMDGRIDDIYKINGENVSPKYIEEILSDCDIADSVQIVGVRDDKCGYVGACFAQLVTDNPENRESFEHFCRSRLAGFQIPRYFFYLSAHEWPRTSTGKVQKFRLRAMACERTAAHRSGD